jgi:hypothetical protein
VFDETTGELLGRAHGRRGSDRAHPGLCRRAPARDHRGDLMHTIFPHPTLAR